MKNLRQFFPAVALTFVLTFSANAGEIQTGKTAPPPPPTIAGEIQTGRPASEPANGGSATVDPLGAIVLNILQGILSVF